MTNVYYAIVSGKKTGIYDNWSTVKEYVIGYPNAIYKKFDNKIDAEYYINNGGKIKEHILNKTNDYIDVYCDGSSTNSNGGIGIYWDKNSILNVSKKIDEDNITNQKCELYAIYTVLCQINNIKLFGVNTYNIYTDSMYSINCVTMWINKWVKNNWKTMDGLDVKHKELLSDIYHEYNMSKLKYNINIIHIKSKHTRNGNIHNDGNYYADKLAKESYIQ